MPRYVQENARRNTNRQLVARKCGGHAPSLADAYEDYLSDIALSGEVRRVVQARRDVLAGVGWISPRGLRALIDPAIKEFDEAVGKPCFPYNFGPNPNGRNRKVPGVEAKAEIERYARLGGWIRAAAKLPGVRRLLRKGMSPRGMNSQYTYVTPYELAARWPSPGALERRLWAVKARATAILSAYAGDIKPSWVNLAKALKYERRTGKAAVIAVAMQLGWQGPATEVWRDEKGYYHTRPTAPAYRQAREWLAYHRSAAYPVVDTTDGVELRLSMEPELTKLGIQVFSGLVTTEAIGRWGTKVVPCRKVVWLVRKGERSYHQDSGDATWAIHQAVRAWRWQDKHAAEVREQCADLVSFLDGSEFGFCPLIYREDSYAAGNCSAGTREWVLGQGWSSKDFIPGPWLVQHLDDGRVRRVVNATRQRRLYENQAIAA